LLTLGTLRRPHFACEQYIIWTHQREYYIGKSFYGGLHFKEGETSGFTATDDRAISIHGKTLGLQTRKLKSGRIHCMGSQLGHHYIERTSQIISALHVSANEALFDRSDVAAISLE